MKEIMLTKGKVALVNDEDFEELNKHKWHCNSDGYAVRNLLRGKIKIWMHREILQTPKNKMTDHINGNKLDNRKENLRIANDVTNQQNKIGYSSNGFKGVCKHKNRKNKPYFSTIRVMNRSIFLGGFSSVIEAAKAYDEAAIKYFGEFARINQYG